MKVLKILCNTIFLLLFSCSVVLLFAPCVFAQNDSNKNALIQKTQELILSLPDYGRVQEDIFLEVNFQNILPQSAIPSIKVICLETSSSGKVDTLPGVPKTRLRFDTAGEYLLEVKIGYLLKST